MGLLAIQQLGSSQKEMLEILRNVLAQYSISTPNNHGRLKEFVYLDDGIFGGGHVIKDLNDWIETSAPQWAKVQIITIARHTGGKYHAGEAIAKKAKGVGKEISIQWRSERNRIFEDRKSKTDYSDVLRPKQIPNVHEVTEYVKKLTDAQFSPTLRKGDSLGLRNIFSSPEGRNLLEEQLLIAGCRIMKQCTNLPKNARPLGFSPLKTLGFGSMMVTYRNCPNNSPLALWVGEPCWYPLFQRRTNNETTIRDTLNSL